MRLNELKPSHAKLLSRKKDWKDWWIGRDAEDRNSTEISNDISVWLEKRGYKRLGSGFFSDVYKHPDSKIAIKFNGRPDKGYQSFVEYVNEHKSNPHFPKMSPLHKIGKHNFIVFMEELKQWEPMSDELEFFENLFERANNPYTVKDAVLFLLERYPELSDEYDSFIEAIIQVSVDSLDYEVGMDFKSPNIMKRSSDGHLVITDPWYG